MGLLNDIFLCILFVVQIYSDDDLCSKRFGPELQIINSRNLALRQPLVCKNALTPISLRIREQQGNSHRSKVVIRRCPSVHSVWLNIPGRGGTILTVKSSNGVVTSCNGTNNTFILARNKRGHRDKSVISVFLGADDIDFLILTYDLKNHDEMNTFSYQVDIHQRAGQDHFRHKREATNAKVENSMLPVGCGHERSCIRFGSPQCAHMECSYFVSYSRIGSTNMEIEISAKTPGWAAIGFSSDDKMGGGDDVLVCKRKTDYSDDVEAVSMTNTVAHARPERKDSKFNLTFVKYADGFIYCKIVRPLKISMEGHLDLFNDWFQLYGQGQITSTGVMLQHDDIPPTSESKITVLIPVNIQNSMATTTPFSFTVIIVATTIAFSVS